MTQSGLLYMTGSYVSYLIVGLGNPGQQYQSTRHNCGFDVVEVLARRWGIPLREERRFQAHYGEGPTPMGKQRLLLPQTYMNRSGQAVRATVDWFKLDPERVLVIYDDMDLPLGRIRLRQEGSAGGHNGMRSIIEYLGSQQFPRLRVGVGKPKSGSEAVVGHVLGGFSPAEQPCIQQVLKTAADCIETILKQDLARAMNHYNPLKICEPAPSVSAPAT